MLYMYSNLVLQMPILNACLTSCEGSSWLPLGRGTRSGLLEHAVNLLEGKTLGLGDEEVGVDEGACAKTSPDEEDVGPEVALVGVDHVGGDDGDDGVPEPVGGGGETDTTGTDRDGEDFTDDDPCTWTPSGGEEEDEDTDEGDLGVDSGDVVGDRSTVLDVSMVEADGVTNDTDEELADKHAQSTPKEEGATTEPLDGPEGNGGGQHVDESEDEGDEESVLDGTSRLEERSRIVEDEVDTSPLLHHLEGGTEDSATKVALCLPEGAGEAAGP
jgi:hypothetical protein